MVRCHVAMQADDTVSHDCAWLRLPCIHKLIRSFAPAASVKGIPEFWSTVLLKCDTTAEMIKDKDLEVLNYLQDIQVGGRPLTSAAMSSWDLTCTIKCR